MPKISTPTRRWCGRRDRRPEVAENVVQHVRIDEVGKRVVAVEVSENVVQELRIDVARDIISVAARNERVEVGERAADVPAQTGFVVVGQVRAEVI
ncbi:MAG TPA: hypothetical protein VIL65_13930 [Beijerinckiaceae bacterium]